MMRSIIWLELDSLLQRGGTIDDVSVDVQVDALDWHVVPRVSIIDEMDVHPVAWVIPHAVSATLEFSQKPRQTSIIKRQRLKVCPHIEHSRVGNGIRQVSNAQDGIASLSERDMN